jgi:hypothetical protein
MLSNKSVIVKTHRFSGLSLTESGTFADFVRKLKQEAPSVPQVGKGISLTGLRGKPFEPLLQVDMRYLTFNTVFLIVLAPVAEVN